MSDLRSLLNEVVDEPAATHADMDEVVRRAGRHSARQRWLVALVAVAIAALGMGAAALMFGGRAVMPAAKTSQPTPSAVPSNPAPSARPAKPCTAEQLSGPTDTAFAQGFGQSLYTPITVVNRGPEPCLLTGRPMVRILGPQGALSVRASTTPPAGPTGSGGIRVEPGKTAVVMVEWSNYCGGPLRLDQIAFELKIGRGQRAYVVGLTNGGGYPPVCNQPKHPSTLGVSRWSYPGS